MKRILVVGAGLSATSLIYYLLENSDKNNWQVTVADYDYNLALQKVNDHPNGIALDFDVFDVEQARQHNDMNVLCIGADYTDFDTAKYMIEAFFETKFLKGRHTRRVKKLDEDTNTN